MHLLSNFSGFVAVWSHVLTATGSCYLPPATGIPVLISSLQSEN